MMGTKTTKAKWEPKVAAERAAHIATKDRYAAAQAQATAKAVATARTIETHWRQTNEDTETALRSELDRALASVDRLRQPQAGRAAVRATGRPDPAPTATAPADPAGAGPLPQLDDSDLRICTENTVKARGWQVYFNGVSAALQEPVQ